MAKSVDDRGRGARMARRDEGAYSLYVTEEQRSQPGCSGREGDRLSHSRTLSSCKYGLFIWLGLSWSCQAKAPETTPELADAAQANVALSAPAPTSPAAGSAPAAAVALRA